MKKLSLLVLAAVSLTGCWTSIFTVAPTVEPVEKPKTVYTTTVTTPAPKTTTVTTFTVTSYSTDPCLYLDLNAVAAAFAESRSVGEFEQLLNSSRYMINNLDLNRDGWVDYLRVIETSKGYYHTLLIQACLAPGVFQDVATLIAERRADLLYVEVVGDRYLYGANYIVRPVFVKRPPLWDVYGRPGYAVWVSPYHYGSLPSYYKRPQPIYLNHYQAYVTTYMTNHHYCHHCDYPTTVFYSNYTSMTQPNSRQDYQRQHPNESFEQRVTRVASANTNGVSVRNAGQLRNMVAKETNESKDSKETKDSGTSSRSAATSSSTIAPASSRSGSTTTATSSKSSTSSSSSASTATASSAKTGTSARSTATQQTTKQQPQRQPSTTVETKVNKSGTTRTTVKTTDATGRTSTVKRESGSSVRSTSTPARSTNKQESKDGSSVRSSQGGSSGSTPRSGQRGR